MSTCRTTRERREARAARLTEWSDSRTAKAQVAYEQSRAMADLIPFGQPVLVGHYSQGRDQRYRGRITGKMDQAVEHAAKAQEMASKAANIRAAADASIFSDDPDAIGALKARIAGWEAEKATVKAYNATCRKGDPDPMLLNDRQRADLIVVARYSHLGKGGQFPAYHLANLNGRIAKDRDRLARLESGQA